MPDIEHTRLLAMALEELRYETVADVSDAELEAFAEKLKADLSKQYNKP